MNALVVNIILVYKYNVLFRFTIVICTFVQHLRSVGKTEVPTNSVQALQQRYNINGTSS